MNCSITFTRLCHLRLLQLIIEKEITGIKCFFKNVSHKYKPTLPFLFKKVVFLMGALGFEFPEGRDCVSCIFVFPSPGAS